jgi:hypothetical protein
VIVKSYFGLLIIEKIPSLSFLILLVNLPFPPFPPANPPPSLIAVPLDKDLFLPLSSIILGFVDICYGMQPNNYPLIHPPIHPSIHLSIYIFIIIIIKLSFEHHIH